MGLDMMHTNPRTNREVITRHENIIKSSEDKREYRGIELQNLLKVLLVSDPTTDKSAAALTVNIGSLSDPEDAPGLAHFCEHMLFLGTKKYPEENSYSKYLSEHGGASNAYTASDHTTYYFDIIPDHLSSALDIFSQFFISPLFTISCTDRELQAVNSEHDKNICNDVWRLDQLNKSTSDPNHPYHKFGTGNKETLDLIPKNNGINIRDELLKFHSEWYSANIMSLVIFGKESLDELEKMASDMFSLIENKEVNVPKWPQHPYTELHQGVQLKVVPIKDIRNLIMTFPIPDTRLHYKSAPSHYISHLIGHEGPGSLLSLLKAKGWCNSLSSSAHHAGRGFGMFNVHVDLTENGIKHTDNIVEMLFQYINLLNKEGIQKWIFDEQATILATGFRFKDKEEPRKLVVGSVHDILEYPMEHVISAHWHLVEWKPELIQELLSMLTPERIRIAVIAKAFESVCDQSEKWYSTKYKLETISKELIERWSTCGLSENLAMPLPNSFLPDSLDLCTPDPESKEYPSIVYDSPIMRVWYKQDNEYFLPKLDSFFEFTIPIAYSDPLNCGLNTLFVMLLLDSLNEYAYAAELAGISYQILNTKSGLSVQLDGYDSKQHVLLECIIDKIVSFRVNPERFAILKENFVRGLKNFDTQQPYEHGAFYLGLMLTELGWSKKEYLEVAPAINLENLQDFIDRFFLKVHVECLIHGNITKNKAIELASIIEKKLPKNIIPLLPQQLTLGREIQLEKGSHYRLEIDHTVHCSSCAVIYFQCGVQCTSKNVLLELLTNILNEPCFNILRTKEQLGYIVFSGVRRSNGVQGISVLVQSDRHPSYIESRIEAFLEHMDSYLSKQTDEEFENHRESLIAEKLKRPKMLLGRSIIYRSEILSQQYHFDRVNVEVKALKQISKKQLYDFYKEILSIGSSNRKKLGVHVVSSAVGGAAHPDTDKTSSDSSNESKDLLPVPEDPSKIVLIEDIVSFKSGRGLYPLIAPYTNVPRKGTHCKL